MTIPADDIAFQIVSVVGLTLPIFFLAVDTFDNGLRPDRLIWVSTLLLIGSAIVSLAALALPPVGEADPYEMLAESDQLAHVIRFTKNLLVDLGIGWLATGYLGLGSSVHEMIGLDLDITGRFESAMRIVGERKVPIIGSVWGIYTVAAVAMNFAI